MTVLIPEAVLKPVTWHIAHPGLPVWFDYRGKLVEGVVASFGNKRLKIVRDGAECTRPFGEVFIRKVSGPPTLVAYRR